MKKLACGPPDVQLKPQPIINEKPLKVMSTDTTWHCTEPVIHQNNFAIPICKPI